MTRSIAQAETGPEEAVKLADDPETAEYISDLVTQLERLARTHGLVRLQYLLGACREEAQKIAAGDGAA